MTALNGACQQQPVPGSLVSLQGSLFSTTQTNITAPSATPSGTYTPSNSKFPLGAKIGVAVAGVIVILVIAGVCIIWRGKRRRRSFLRKHQQETGYADWVAAQQSQNTPMSPSFPSATFRSPRSPRRDMFEADTPHPDNGGPFWDSPQSQKPLVSNMPWGGGAAEDISPANEKVYFSPYTSHHTSPVSATDHVQPVGQQWPLNKAENVGGTSGFVGTPQARSRSREKKDKPGDHFEMQSVGAPTLHHPGHGRQESQTSTHSLGLTEEDHRRGSAI